MLELEKSIIEECGACNSPVEGSDDDESFVF
jgi:hypothetical protein